MQPWCSSLDRNIYRSVESSDQVFSLSATKGVLPPACHNYRTFLPAEIGDPKFLLMLLSILNHGLPEKESFFSLSGSSTLWKVCASLGVRLRGSAYFITNTIKNYWLTTGYVEGVFLSICGPLPNDEKTPETKLRKKNVTKWILEHVWLFQQWKQKQRKKKSAFMPVSWRGHYAIGSSWYTGAFFCSFRGSYPGLS